MDNWNSVYQFDTLDNVATRLRRLERGRQYLRGGTLVDGSGSYASVPASLLDGNSINLASSSITAQGSIPPSLIKGNFGFTATTTSITVYWDATNGSTLLELLRASGEVVHIPSGSLTVSGLTVNTSYGFLPYWSPFNNCGIGWIVGDSGSPQFAFTSAARTVVPFQQQILQNREPLTGGFISYSTPPSGTSTGTGTGGGDGGGGYCVILGTDIEPLGDNTYSTKHYQQNDWVRIVCEKYPRALSCTPDHPLFSPDHGKVQASKFKSGQWIITDDGEHKVMSVEKFVRVCTKVAVTMPSGHLFFANGFLSHNKYQLL